MEINAVKDRENKEMPRRKQILPQKLRSPAKEALEPVNEKKGKGTGIGTLMPTCFKVIIISIFKAPRRNDLAAG